MAKVIRIRFLWCVGNMERLNLNFKMALLGIDKGSLSCWKREANLVQRVVGALPPHKRVNEPSIGGGKLKDPSACFGFTRLHGCFAGPVNTCLSHEGKILFLVIKMVGTRGFEPPTSCSQSRRATRLRYVPTATTKLPYHLRSNSVKKLRSPSRRSSSIFRFNCDIPASPVAPLPPSEPSPPLAASFK